MKKWLIFCILLAFPSVLAIDAQQIYSIESMTLENVITAGFDIQETSTLSKIENISAQLYLYPKKVPSQDILYQVTNPNNEITDPIMFSWKDPSESTLLATVTTTAKTKFWMPKVTKKIPFPLKETGMPAEYLNSTELIDFNDPKISELANNLAAGEDDLFVVATKLADWTTANIAYNLSTLTADASQSASWVLENRQGVCDELSTLFISMARSLGIPARFTTGVAYTDLDLFDENWVSHGWAELYFPDVGWVPFDLTYSEYGFTDASHLILDHGSDIDKYSVEYEWVARNVSVISKDLDIKTSIKEIGAGISPPVTMKMDIEKSLIGFGSFNVVVVKLSNPNSYYVPITVSLQRTEGLRNMDSRERRILLLPNEDRELQFLVQVDDTLNEGFKYTFPLKVHASFGLGDDINFEVSEKHRVYSREDFPDYRTDEPPKGTPAPSIQLDCEKIFKYYYSNEQINLSCTTKNTGNMPLNQLKLCGSNCKSFKLGIISQNTSIVTFQKMVKGDYILTAKAGNSQVSKDSKVQVRVIDPLNVTITIEKPGDFIWDKKNNVTVVIKTNTPLHNLKVNLKSAKFEANTEQMEINSSLMLGFFVSGWKLSENDNPVKVDIQYEDVQGKQIEQEYSGSFRLEQIGFFQRLLRFAIGWAQ